MTLRHHQLGLCNGIGDLDELDVNLYLDLVAHQPAARFQRHIPIQAPIFAIDLGVRRKTRQPVEKAEFQLHNAAQGCGFELESVCFKVLATWPC